MKVDESNSSGLKGLVKNQRNLVAAKEREIEDVRKLFDARKESERFIGQQEIVEVKDANQKEVLEAVDRKAARLEEMQKNFKSELSRLEKERNTLTEQRKLEREATLALGSDDQDRVIQDGIERSREIAQRANSQISTLQQEGQWQIAKTTEDTKRKLDVQVKKGDAALADRTQMQKLQITTTELENKHKLDQLKSDYDKDLRQLNRLNFKDKANAEQGRQKELDTIDKQGNYLLTEKRKQFEQKISHLENEHNKIISRVEDKFKQQLASISSDYASKRDATTLRGDDPFYSLQRLSHSVETQPDSFLVHIEVPEHEADNVVFSGRDRTLKLTLSRRFSERLDGEAGSVDINKRSESFTKEFEVADIVNPKAVTKKYEDGILTYKILKA